MKISANKGAQELFFIKSLGSFILILWSVDTTLILTIMFYNPKKI